MKTCLLLLFSWLAIMDLSSQEIPKFLIASAGDYFVNNSGQQLHWSLGELCTELLVNQEVISQGFHQLSPASVPIWEWDPDGLKILVYPNPFSSHITIEQTGLKSYSVEIHDVLGKLVWSKHEAKPKESLYLGELPDQPFLLTIKAQAVRKSFVLLKSTF